MELDEFVDKYRGLKLHYRYLLVAILACAPAGYLWSEEGDALVTAMAEAEASFLTEQQAFENARQKAAELPAREAQLAEVEGELTKAKEFLPDKIEIDTILGFIGGLEKELNVTLVKFTPQAETAGRNGGEYKEVPVEIEMQGTFVDTMRFMDRLVHMQSLTHMRNIRFTATEEVQDKKKPVLADARGRKVDSKAKLILFKGI